MNQQILISLNYCEILNEKFTKTPKLAVRFPDSPCAQKEEAQTLISFVKDRPGHDARYAVDITKIQENLGYKPNVQFRVGLAETVDWYLENEDLVAIYTGWFISKRD